MGARQVVAKFWPPLIGFKSGSVVLPGDMHAMAGDKAVCLMGIYFTSTSTQAEWKSSDFSNKRKNGSLARVALRSCTGRRT